MGPSMCRDLHLLPGFCSHATMMGHARTDEIVLAQSHHLPTIPDMYLRLSLISHKFLYRILDGIKIKSGRQL